MRGNTVDVQVPATELEIAEALRWADDITSAVIRKLAFERDARLVHDRAAYDLGYRNGLEAYAYWRDGIEYVGTNGRTLDQAIAERKATWNYKL